MIELGNQYRTRDGREVRIYAVDGSGPRIIHGAVNIGGEWDVHSWLEDGRYYTKETTPSTEHDLIEIRPRAIDRMIELLQMHMNAYSQQFGPNPYRLLIEEARRFKAEEDAQS